MGLLSKWFCFGLLILFSFAVKAQYVTSVHYGASEGFPSDEVYDVAVDAKGILWFGASDGLIKHQVFGNKIYLSPTRTSNSISNIRFDSKGTLWCSNFTGQVFYLEKDSLKELTILRKFLSKGFATFEIVDDKLYLALSDKVVVYSINNRQIASLATPKGFLVHDVFLSANQVLMHASEKGIAKFEVTASQPFQLLESNTSGAIKSWSNQDLLVSLDVDYLHLNFWKWKSKKLVLDTILKPSAIGKLNSVCLQNNVVLLCTNNGLYRYSSNGIEPILKGPTVSKALFLKNGQLWCTTLSNGVYQISALNSTAYPLENYLGKEDKITHLVKANDNLVFATAKGIVAKLNSEGGVIQQNLSKEMHNVQSLRYFSAQQKLLVMRGTFLGLNLDLKEQFNISNRSAVKDAILKGDTLFFASSFGTGYTLLSDAKHFSHYYNGIRTRKICRVHERLYSLGQAGLECYNVVTSKSYLPAKYWANVQDFAIINGNVLWVDREGKLYLNNHHFALNTDIHEPFKKIVSEDNAVLLIADHTVVVLRRDGKTKMVGRENGLGNNRILTATVVNGNLWLAGDKELLRIKLEEITELKTQPVLWLEEVLLDGRAISPESLYLPYTHAAFTIKYAIGNRFGKTENEFITYRLDNGTWVNATLSGNLAFLSLPSGKHTIDLNIRLANGKLGKGTKLYLFVEFPFWQKWWFYLLVTVSTSGLVVLYYRYRIRQSRKKAEQRLKEERLKNQLELSVLKAIKSQLNPHFIFNALNSIQGFVYKNDKNTANQYLGKFAQLMRMILNMSNENAVKLAEELKALKLYLELEAIQLTDFTFNIQIASDVDEGMTRIPSMLIQPYVENAIKHGLMHKSGGKSLIIHISEQQDFLVVQIEDNGIGREESAKINSIRSKEHKSFATDANKTRLDLLNSGQNKVIGVEFIDKFENGQASGTTVILRIPIPNG